MSMVEHQDATVLTDEEPRTPDAHRRTVEPRAHQAPAARPGGISPGLNLGKGPGEDRRTPTTDSANSTGS